jgi:hypothetical protein
LAKSQNPDDQKLWADWYQFTIDMAVAGAFSSDATEQKMARTFITTALQDGAGTPASPGQDVFATPASCRAAIEALAPSPDHMFFFEYNFLYVLAADGRAEKAALGDHTPAGYRQRARFYAISGEARLNYAKGVAGYLIFLAENTGLVAAERCAAARDLLNRYQNYNEFYNAISR